MVIVGRDGKIVLINNQMEKMFGYPRQELLGQPVEILLPEPLRGKHISEREGFFAKPEARAMGAGRTLCGQRKDGSEMPIEIGLNPIERPEGTFVLASILDITERKKVEWALLEKTAEIERSNRDLEQFAYVVSHDLQEPLRMISNFTQLLSKRYKGKLDQGADEFIGFAVDGVTRMQRMISDLLEYSRIGTHGNPFETIDCADVLESALSNLKASIEENSAVITHDELPKVLGDAGELEHLFQNLIGNAIKFRSDEPPKIHIGAEEKNGERLFSCQDNGIGIDPQYFDRIFILFQRLHKRNEYCGTGIGLAICKKVVERHGGRIWVESEPGKGTSFFFTLGTGACLPICESKART